MAELATAEAAPETDAPSTEALAAQETDQVEETADTEGDNPETQQETFTQADIDRQVQEAVEKAKQELQEQRDEEQFQIGLRRAHQHVNVQLDEKVRGMVGWAFREFEAGHSLEEAERRLKAAVVEDIVNPTSGALFTQQVHAIADRFFANAKRNSPDWKPSPQTLQRYTAAMSSLKPDLMADALTLVYEDYHENVTAPKAVKAREDAEKAKQKPVNALKAKQAEDAARNAQERPTGLAGGSSPRQQFSTMLQVDTAFAEGKITDQEMYRYLALHKEGRLPYR